MSEKVLQKTLDQLLARQNKDGGWGQDKELPSDAYATGQALYYLSLSDIKNDHQAIVRGVAYLLTNQKEDGSWPTKPRAHPGEKPASNVVPINYFGSAWATLGLIRNVRK